MKKINLYMQIIMHNILKFSYGYDTFIAIKFILNIMLNK